MLTHSITHTVGGGDSDLFGFMRPSALLGLLQHAAEEHAVRLGASREDLPGDIIWMLAKIAYFLEKPIKTRQETVIETWPRGARGACFYRDFDIAADGEHVGHAISAWVMADPQTLRLVRPKDYPVPSIPPEKCKYTDTLGKLVAPESLTPAMTRVIRYSDLDINGHLNNTRYAELCCDALCLDSRPPRYIGAMQINYRAECKSGEEIAMSCGEYSKNECYVTGNDKNGALRFDARVSLKNG